MEEGKESKDRDAGGGGKGGESVTNPIPIVGGKTKKRGVEYKCESCNKVGFYIRFGFSCRFPTRLFFNKPSNIPSSCRSTATRTA